MACLPTAGHRRLPMKSKYFNCELNIPTWEVTSGGENVNLVPHDALTDIIYNSDFSRNFGITVSTTNLPMRENGHYAFMCVITDKLGHRVEGYGEATEANLDTDIARAYPSLMAFKRAFDAAALLYLGLDGKVYSDQQINSKGPASQPSQRSQQSQRQSGQRNGQQRAPAQQSQGQRYDNKRDNERRNDGRAPSAPQSNNRTRVATNYGAPPDDDDDDDDSHPAGADEEAMPTDIDDPRFDIVIDFGRFHDHPMPLRDAYHCRRSALDWVNQFEPFDAYHRRMKELCIAYLNLMDEANGGEPDEAYYEEYDEEPDGEYEPEYDEYEDEE